MLDAPAVLQVTDLERAQLSPAQPVVEQHRQDGAVPLAFQSLCRRRVEQCPRLSVTDGGRLTLVGFARGSLHPAQRVEGHRVLFAQVIKQAGQGRELPADRSRRVTAPLQFPALGECMGAGHQAELPCPGDAHKTS